VKNCEQCLTEIFAEASSFCTDMTGGACCLVYDLDGGGLGHTICLEAMHLNIKKYRQVLMSLGLFHGRASLD
jgi:hypothetical protein